MTKEPTIDMAMNDTPVVADRLKTVLRHLPAPVAIVTSFDPNTDEPIGLAVSALMPVSLAPCSMAIAVNRSAAAHAGLMESGALCINLIEGAVRDSLMPFADASSRHLRFAGPEWRRRGRVWFTAAAPANIFCTVRTVVSHGTHDVMICDVDALLHNGTQDFLVWANGALGRVAPVA